MAVVKINLSCELSEAVKVQYLHGNLFSQDNQANEINVSVFEDGEPVELAGTVTANVIRPDGGTVAVTGGTYSGNVATITMPSAVYAIPGAISVAVKITLDSVVTTIAAFAATVYATSTDTAVDPGTIIPSIQTLITEIEAAVDSIPADYSSLWATLAPNYSNLTFPVEVGQYCTYDGGFYRCNTAIATQEAWTAAHWTATNIGADLAETRLDVANLEDDVSELKSAIGTVPTGKTVQGQIDALENGLEKGTYEDLTAGNALYLLSDRGDTDVAPYVFRKTGGAKNGYGREFLRKIVGGTVAWNQLVTDSAKSGTSNNITYTREAGKPFVLNGTALLGLAVVICTDFIPVISGHKYLITGGKSANVTIQLSTQPAWGGPNPFDEGNGKIANCVQSNSTQVVIIVTAGTELTSEKIIPQLFDLTKMFGSTIADAIYAMEQATAGSGVAWFRSLFPNDYYAYDAGSLQSVQTASKKTVGFNLADNTKIVRGSIGSNGVEIASETRCRSELIRVLPNAKYYACLHRQETGQNIYEVHFYNVNKNWIGYSSVNDTSVSFDAPSNACYIKLLLRYSDNRTTVPADWNEKEQLNFYNASKNGIYEPYESHTYPFDPDLVLRGIPKWDSTNGLYYDGDEYKPDGSVKRKYGIVDLGTLNWAYSSDKSMFYVELPGMSEDSSDKVRCGKYYYGITNFTWSIASSCVDKSVNTTRENDWLYVKDSAYTDAATFKTAMSGVYLVYELATPTTESADAFRELEICSKYGTEEFVDAGVTASTPTRDVSIPVGTETFYPIDVVAYIEELTNPDHDMVADALIQSGKYFMVGNSLYKSTSQIQAGDIIIPGSNCTAKTLAEALNELNA